MRSAHAIALSLLTTLGVAAAQEEPAPSGEALKFFEDKIRPALSEHCYKCHSTDEKIRGGLNADNRAGLRHGGDSGPAVVPGDLEKSLLWTAVTWADEDYQMPPKDKLPANVIADIKRWITMGAPDPRVPEKAVVKTEIDIEAGRKFWSFQAPLARKAPALADSEWPASDVDRFVLAKLQEEKLQPAPAAKPDALLRRLYFDLIGLPPSPKDIEAYALAWKKDPEAAYNAKVSELLASERFGERWGRHWLDVARYGESSGKEVNLPFPQAWRYRDYVIDSFNADKPYDEFVKEQLAGDLLPIKNDEDWRENLVATGFLALGPKGLNERNPRQFALDLADEQVDATSQAFLGLTLSCARCHDHKTDPIPTADYYALSGIFQSTKTYFGTVNLAINRRGTKLLELPVPDQKPTATLSAREIAALDERIEEAEQELQDLLQEARRQRLAGQPVAAAQRAQRQRSQVAQLRARRDGFDDKGLAKSLAMGVQDQARPVQPVVLVRGELDRPAQKVERGFPQVLQGAHTAGIPSRSSGRLELAEWIASPGNPLTARVMVNRVWAQLFGSGLVDSPNNFGATGQRPSHPGLLDHLALQFVADGWSVKSLIRELVSSRSYRMASDYNAVAYEADPENRLLWRMTPRRLDAEALRDAMLAASGKLDLTRPQGSMVSQGAGTNAPVALRSALGQLNKPVEYRSVYLPIVRDNLPEALALFDGSDPNRAIGTREETNVPGQALYLMNNSFVIAQADAMAKRLIAGHETAGARITAAFQLCYGRGPTKAEIAASQSFFRQFELDSEANSSTRGRIRRQAFTVFCQSLFASAEFRYLN